MNRDLTFLLKKFTKPTWPFTYVLLPNHIPLNKKKNGTAHFIKRWQKSFWMNKFQEAGLSMTSVQSEWIATTAIAAKKDTKRHFRLK